MSATSSLNLGHFIKSGERGSGQEEGGEELFLLLSSLSYLL
ncbi:MAG: hypothetical protein ACJ71X_07300 [Nitrososphaeraceae archaeon]